jgi:fructose/tagatose bisphosphate aldolase
MPEVGARVIITHTLAHMREAHEAARSLNTPLVLQTATGALRFAGAQYLLSMFAKARAEFPDVASILILNCDDAGAETISAMRIGHTHIRSSAAEQTRAKLVDIARQLGVTVVEGDYEALDLRYSYRVREACVQWLGGDTRSA